MRRLALGIGDEGGRENAVQVINGRKRLRRTLIKSFDYRRFLSGAIDSTGNSREAEGGRKMGALGGQCCSVGSILDLLISHGHPGGSVGWGLSQELRALAIYRPVS